MFVIFRDYCTDIGWDKAYFNEADPDDSMYSYGCAKHEATVFPTEELAKAKCEELNKDIFEFDEKYRYTALK